MPEPQTQSIEHELHGGNPIGFALFNAVLCCIFITLFLIVVPGWPLTNSVAMGALVALVAGAFVVPAFCINVCSVMAIGITTVFWGINLIHTYIVP